MKASKKVLKHILRKLADEAFHDDCYDRAGDFKGIGKLPREILAGWIAKAQAELEPNPEGLDNGQNLRT